MPTHTKELLQAQASGGREGAQAYKAASEQLKAQRQAAIERAMQESALRGSPAAAMESIQSQMTRPYDAEIATMTGAAATADQMAASREQRMVDYNASVGAARGLIGDQVEQSVAPINAQSDFLIRQLEQQGQNRVAELEGQLRLEMARLEAQARARGGGGRGRGGGGGGRQMGAERSIATVAGQARNDLRATAPQVASAVRQNRTDLNSAAMRALRQTDSAAGGYSPDRRQAGSTGPNAVERRQGRIEAAGDLRSSVMDRVRGALFDPKRRVGESSTPVVPSRAGATQSSAAFMTPPDSWVPPSQQRSAGGAFSGGMGGLVRSILNQRQAQLPQSVASLPQPASAENRRFQAMRPPSSTAPAEPSGVTQEPPRRLYQQIREMQGQMFGGPNAPGFLSGADLQRFSDDNPLALAALAGGPLRNEDDVYGRLLGSGPKASPYAEDAMQQAMLLAAERLIGQGYNLNEEAILNALSGGADAGYQFGDTVAGQDARMNPEPEPEPGLLTAAQRQEIKDEDLLAGRDERLTEQQQQQFTAQTGLEVPSGVPVEVAAGAFNSDRDREIQAWVVQNAESMRRDNLSVRELLMFRGMADIGFDPADPFDYAILAMLEQRIGG